MSYLAVVVLAPIAACASEVVTFGTGGSGAANAGGAGAANVGGSGGMSSTSVASANGGDGTMSSGAQGGDVTCACEAASDCPIPPGFCAVAVCKECACGVAISPAGTSCGPNGKVCTEGGQCVSGLGAPCGEGGECASGFCADGVCCESACDGACVSCALKGAAGSCDAESAGTLDAACPGGSCDAVGGCSNGAHIFDKLISGYGSEVPFAVAIDAKGNVVVAGMFQQSLDIEGKLFAGVGNFDVFVASFTSTGTLSWVKTFGGSGPDAAYGLAVDSASNVVLAGVFEGTVNFGGDPLTSAGGADVFVLKLDPSGNHLFSKRYGSFFGQTARAVLVAPDDSIVVAGHFSNTIDFGNAAITSMGNTDIFVAKLDKNGGAVFSKRFGDWQAQELYGLALDKNARIALTGRFMGAMNVAGTTLTGAGNGDVYAIVMAADGTESWGRGFGDGAEQFGRGVAFDSSGGVILHGYFHGVIDLGLGAVPSLGGNDAFLMRLDSLGKKTTFARLFSNASEQVARSVAVDANDNIVVTGYAQGDVDFGGGLLKNTGSSDVYLAKYTLDGTHLFSKLRGSTGNEWGLAVGVEWTTGAIVTAGYMNGSIDFGGGPLVTQQNEDGYLVKLGP
ncbi:MAG: hypothetical protein EXR75_08935 [Myxococcales bacterium]|nr:hypothetical protein [Myxococcales bacterium]